MTDGIYINGRRPKSKKEIKDAVRDAPDTVHVECTSMHGGFSGPVSEIVRSITFVGPDPYTNRKFYGNIVRGPKGLKVT